MNLMICWTGKTMVDKAPDQKKAEKTDDVPKIQSDFFLLLVHPVHKQKVRISEAAKDEGDEESFLSLEKVHELDYLLDPQEDVATGSTS